MYVVFVCVFLLRVSFYFHPMNVYVSSVGSFGRPGYFHPLIFPTTVIVCVVEKKYLFPLKGEQNKKGKFYVCVCVPSSRTNGRVFAHHDGPTDRTPSLTLKPSSILYILQQLYNREKMSKEKN